MILYKSEIILFVSQYMQKIAKTVSVLMFCDFFKDQNINFPYFSPDVIIEVLQRNFFMIVH